MSALVPALERLGDAATTAELSKVGFHPKQLAAAVHRGDIERIRRGWYALPSLDSALRTALRIGGRLGCVSAATHYGWAVPEDHGVHVSLAENASRLRHPLGGEQIVLHWSSPMPRSDRSRLIVDRFEAVVQLAICLAPAYAVAALDSFLHLEPTSSRRLDEWLAHVPAHVVAALPRTEPLCHSFLETIGRVKLAADGITGVHQVEIDGVGRVDLVIDGWLVIEWDGRTHEERAQRHDDARRDALLASLGYRVLRFTYPLVMNEWYVVIGAVRAALAGGRFAV